MKDIKIEEEVEKANALIQSALAGNNYPKNTQIKLPVKVGIFIDGGQDLIPEYETKGASGLDVRANISSEITLQPLERRLIPTGLYVDIPDDHEFQLRPRSGISWNKGLTLINGFGTIDDDYIGHIQIPLVNLSNEPQTIEPNERIAQLVLMKVEKVEWDFADSTANFKSKDRNGGFGSTVKK